MTSVSADTRLSSLLRYFLCAIMFLVIAVPLYISVGGGRKSMGQLRAEPMALPHPWYWNQYSAMLTGKLSFFWRELANSC